MATVQEGVPEALREITHAYQAFLRELLDNPSRAKTLSYDETPRGRQEAIHGMRALQYLRTRWWAKGRFTTHIPAFKRVGNRVYIFMVDLKDIPLYWGGKCPEDIRQAAIQRRLKLES